MVDKKLIFKSKYLLLVSMAKLFELMGISSKSSLLDGTFSDEEFPNLKKIFGAVNNLTVIDVGANRGIWAQNLLQCAPNAKIYALEPSETFYRAIINIDDERIVPLNIALSSISKSLVMHEKGGGGSAYFDETKNSKPGAKNFQSYETVPITGDDLIESHRIRVDFLKIDTDGMDFDVLKSFKRCLEIQRPFVQFEFTFRFASRAGYTLTENISYLSDLGYKIFVIDKRGNLVKVKFPRLEVLNHQSKNFWAIPMERVSYVLNILRFSS